MRYTSSDELTELIKEATQCNDIEIGVSTFKPEFGFLCYPVPWCKHIEKLTGLNKKSDVLPTYLALVMHANTQLFDNELVPQIEGYTE